MILIHLNYATVDLDIIGQMVDKYNGTMDTTTEQIIKISSDNDLELQIELEMYRQTLGEQYADVLLYNGLIQNIPVDIGIQLV